MTAVDWLLTDCRDLVVAWLWLGPLTGLCVGAALASRSARWRL